MRDALAYNMLPIVEDSMTVFRGLNAISSNGYYGYQPSLGAEKHTSRRNKRDSNVEMEVDHVPEDASRNQHQQPATATDWNPECCYQYRQEPANRKRSWEFSSTGEDLHQFKKRRENEPCLFTQHQQPVTAPGRKPTHNIPDMPRCIMGHYI